MKYCKQTVIFAFKNKRYYLKNQNSIALEEKVNRTIPLLQLYSTSSPKSVADIFGPHIIALYMTKRITCV